jgi:GntR family transcriptional repressor for pyruvate dehydrogenase complex
MKLSDNLMTMSIDAKRGSELDGVAASDPPAFANGVAGNAAPVQSVKTVLRRRSTQVAAAVFGGANNPGPAAPLIAERLSDRLAALLSAQLASGALAVGDRLPTEARLSAVHQVSRSVVREAVHQLKSRALVIARQGSGVFVAPAAANQPLVFDDAVLGSAATVTPVLEVRRALEGEIAALAAERATRSQVAAIRKALAAIDIAAVAGRDGVVEDLAFHHAIAAATGNPLFSQLLGFLEQYLRSAMVVTRANEARRQDFFDAVRAEHRAIFDAIAEHDAVAARRNASIHMATAAIRLADGAISHAARAAETPKAAKAAPASNPARARRRSSRPARQPPLPESKP